MAPSSGHVLVPKAVNAIRFAIPRTSALIRARLSQATATSTTATLAPVRLSSQPIHPLALLRQSRSQKTRLFSTFASRLSSSTAPLKSSARHATRILPQSTTRTFLTKTPHAPFSSPLRPNLTGGALNRTAGGYAFGGGARGAARQFSHVPAAQAQVVQSVSQAVRAFCLQGKRARFEGADDKGRARFGVVGVEQEIAARKISSSFGYGMGDKESRGTTLEFSLVPAVTALDAATEIRRRVDVDTLAALAADFDAARASLAKVQADLGRIAALGELPISTDRAKSSISVRFPGCDGASVERLCAELGVTRGVVREDAAWGQSNLYDSEETTAERPDRDVEMALLFPWAPGAGADSACASQMEVESCGDAAGYFAHAPTGNRGFGWESMMSASASVPASNAETRSGSRSGVARVESLGTSTHEEETLGESMSFDEVGLSDVESDAGSLGRAQMLVDAQASAAGYESIYRFLSELDRADRR